MKGLEAFTWHGDTVDFVSEEGQHGSGTDDFNFKGYFPSEAVAIAEILRLAKGRDGATITTQAQGELPFSSYEQGRAEGAPA